MSFDHRVIYLTVVVVVRSGRLVSSSQSVRREQVLSLSIHTFEKACMNVVFCII